MITDKPQIKGYGHYVGRVGALAAALGVGVVIAASPVMARAESNAPSASESGSAATGNADSASQQTQPTTKRDKPRSGSITHDRTGTGSASTGDTTSGNPTRGGSIGSASAGPTGSDATGGGSGTGTSGSEATGGGSGTETSGSGTTGTGTSPGTTTTSGDTETTSADTDTETGDANTKADPPSSGGGSIGTESDGSSHSGASTATPKSSTGGGLKSAASATVAAGAGAQTTTSSGPANSISAGVAAAAATVTGAAPATGSTAVTAALAAVTGTDALSTPAATSAVSPVVAIVSPIAGMTNFLNKIVTTLLNPFLAPAPNTPEPLTPVVWAVLGWVRRNLFNQGPSVSYNPTTTVQTGQTITGNFGATDPEGDALIYKVTKGPKYGTLTIDQATGNFTYTPEDINYTAVQDDSFTVSITDGKVNLLGLFTPRGVKENVDVAVLSPTVQRVIVSLPAGMTNAAIPRFAADGKSLIFSATPPDAAAGSRREIYQVGVDGSSLTCLTCGLADPTPQASGSTTPRNLFKPVPFEDGSGRILMQSVAANGSYTHVVYENGLTGPHLVRILTPAGKPGVIATDVQREMRISPDGTHVLFSQIQLVPNPQDPPGFITAVPIVGALTAGVDANGNKVYNITDARVVYPVGEGKQWTHDGKSVIIQGGLYEAGNVDDIKVDLATGQVSRLTGNLDYDEDADLSPNNQWITIDSARGLDALTPVSRIVRPAFVPLLIQGSVYTVYAGTSNASNVSNQPWLIAVGDDLKGEQGIPLFIDGDGWTARSMPSWNSDGTAVAFWEAAASDPTGQTSRLVVANLEYTTSTGAATDKTTPTLSSSLPTLATNTPQQVQLPPTGTYTGAGGGTALVTQTTDATTGHIVRTVTYTDYVNVDGMILNGTETTDQSAAQNTIHYTANVTVSGTHTGSFTGDVTINKLTRTITPTTPTSQIQSTLDGDTLVLLDPARVSAAQSGV